METITPRYINSRWQIISIKNQKFIRIKFYGNDQECSILSQKFQEYEKSCLKNIKSDFDTDINIETTQEENCIDNIDKEFNKISDNNYSAQFESDRYDGWLDCGYMNDITNPYEIY